MFLSDLSSLSETCKLNLIHTFYPIELINNFDPKHSLFGRPSIIERVAICVALGDLRAIDDFIDMVSSFTNEREDLFARIEENMQQLKKSKQYASLPKQLPNGYADYIQAMKETTLEKEIQGYIQAFQKGYYPVCIELAKVKETILLLNTKIHYLKQAFFEGQMMTALDTLFYHFNKDIKVEEKLSLLQIRGEKGDLMGYYKLAQCYEQECHDLINAQKYYQLASPLYGFEELERITGMIEEEEGKENENTPLELLFMRICEDYHIPIK